MNLLSILKSNQNKTIWDEIFGTSPQYKYFKPIIKEFFVQDNVDFRSFLANYKVLEHQSVKLYKTYSKFEENEEGNLVKFLTPGIEKLEFIGDRPLGYYDWFVAAYPDVINWSMDLSDEEMMDILQNPNENEILDKDKKFKNKYLRLLIDAYRSKTDKKLETSIK